MSSGLKQKIGLFAQKVTNMPSTPRMIEIERKASQPGEALTQDNITEWHVLNIRNQPPPALYAGYHPQVAISITPPDYSASIRYLDRTGYRRPMNEPVHLK